MGPYSNNSQHLTTEGLDNRYRCIFVGCSIILLMMVGSAQVAPTMRKSGVISLSRDIVEVEIAQAFDVWSKVSNLTFTRENNESADINIGFFEGSHGDIEPFDGKDGMIAHAFFPYQSLKGTVHFDAAEYWTSRSELGINLFQVAVHEFGHTLGLHHSEVCPSIMWPDYKKYDPNFKLDEDDIRGIQRLYRPHL